MTEPRDENVKAPDRREESRSEPAAAPDRHASRSRAGEGAPSAGGTGAPDVEPQEEAGVTTEAVPSGDTVGGEEIATTTLMIGFLGAPTAWVAHLMASYFLVALGCTTAWGGTRVALGVATVVFAAAAVGAGWRSYRNWQRWRGGQPWDEAISEPRGRNGFMMIAGILLAGVFAITILLAGLPPFFVPICSEGGTQQV